MKLIKLLRNIFNDNKNNERKLSDKRFNVIVKNKIKNYCITNLNVLIGDEHSEHHVIMKFDDEYLIVSDEDNDVLNFNVKLNIRTKQGKLIDEYNFNETVLKSLFKINQRFCYIYNCISFINSFIKIIFIYKFTLFCTYI